VQEGFDIAIRSHQQSLPDSALVQRRLAVHDFHVVAAPTYLERYGTPERPEDLASHRAIISNPTDMTWRLRDAVGSVTDVPVNPVLAADEPFVLLKAAASGIGITVLPTSVYLPAAADGVLRRILPDWTVGQITTTILIPHRRGQLPSVRAVVDFLIETAGTQSPLATSSLNL
jgi:DNA-binding transcriptional LysR family regulator